MTITEPLPGMLRATHRERLAEQSLQVGATQWFLQCRALRQFENEHLLADSNPGDLRAHRVVLSDLIADGELLAWQAREDHFDLSKAGFSVEDIEAERQLLRDNFSLFHESMRMEVAENLLEATFSKSRT
jgi:hypothetical protein